MLTPEQCEAKRIADSQETLVKEKAKTEISMNLKKPGDPTKENEQTLAQKEEEAINKNGQNEEEDEAIKKNDQKEEGWEFNVIGRLALLAGASLFLGMVVSMVVGPVMLIPIVIGLICVSLAIGKPAKDVGKFIKQKWDKRKKEKKENQAEKNKLLRQIKEQRQELVKPALNVTLDSSKTAISKKLKYTWDRFTQPTNKSEKKIVAIMKPKKTLTTVTKERSEKFKR
jgi:hypothetical protein